MAKRRAIKLTLTLVIALSTMAAGPSVAFGQGAGWTPWTWASADSFNISSGTETAWGWFTYSTAQQPTCCWATAGETDAPTVSYEVWASTDSWDKCGGDAGWTHEMFNGNGDANNVPYVQTPTVTGYFLNCSTGHGYKVDGYFQVLVSQSGSWEGGFGTTCGKPGQSAC